MTRTNQVSVNNQIQGQNINNNNQIQGDALNQIQGDASNQIQVDEEGAGADNSGVGDGVSDACEGENGAGTGEVSGDVGGVSKCSSVSGNSKFDVGTERGDGGDTSKLVGAREGLPMRFLCVFYAMPKSAANTGYASSGGINEETSENVKARWFLLIFICVPVSPGNSRLIWSFPRNVGVWIDQVVPRWMFHVGQNLILDSDLYLLHLEERKITDIGPSNWQRACFVPTKADALVVAFRKCLRKYSGGQVDFGTKYSGLLPPSPPKEQLMDR
ncbi:hypothetical protein IFM89_013571 [Coptis chinensis]|uniref:Pheophorbide a oxygenase domain-containing protein n=1 Tax=Coptis chinensis TaxID=261450 RepID=A0A835I0R4_9MAGN|nr:hypothetical protein IFM89_013571 [Coptis chinensis]